MMHVALLVCSWDNVNYGMNACLHDIARKMMHDMRLMHVKLIVCSWVDIVVWFMTRVVMVVVLHAS